MSRFSAPGGCCKHADLEKAQIVKLKKEKGGLDAGLRRTVSLEFTRWTAGAL